MSYFNLLESTAVVSALEDWSSGEEEACVWKGGDGVGVRGHFMRWI